MQVKFEQNWFGPSEEVKANQIFSVSGKRFKRGKVYEMDKDYFKAIPKGIAKIVDGTKLEEPKAAPAPSLKDFDDERAAADAGSEMMEKSLKKSK